VSRLPETLETQRLLLRLPEVADAEDLNGAILASFDELHAWMDWAAQPQSLDETRTFCRDSLTAWKEETSFNCLMIERASGAIVGASGYARLDWSVPKFEIGYWCRTDRVGQGYVSETTWALARHAFEELDARRVELRMDDRNQRSWRVAQRLGFEHEATLKNDVRSPDGSLRDTRVYAATGLATLVEAAPHGPGGVARNEES
jgi:RimJ/RimL family protein N-acetyltransferase